MFAPSVVEREWARKTEDVQVLHQTCATEPRELPGTCTSAGVCTLLSLTGQDDSKALTNDPSPTPWENEKVPQGICSNCQFHLHLGVFQGNSLYFLLGYHHQLLLVTSKNKVQMCDFILWQCKACKPTPEGKMHMVPGEIWFLLCTTESILATWQ